MLTDCQSVAIIIILLLQWESITSWKLASPSWSIYHEIFVDHDRWQSLQGSSDGFQQETDARAQLQLWIQSCLYATVPKKKLCMCVWPVCNTCMYIFTLRLMVHTFKMIWKDNRPQILSVHQSGSWLYRWQVNWHQLFWIQKTPLICCFMQD